MGDPAALAAALGDVLADPVAAAGMAEAGRRAAAAVLGPDRLVGDVVKVYEDVTST